jgi:release factor glutamine methyltransferase
MDIAGQTIREAYVQASSFLRERGIMEPESNARQLAEHVLGLTRTELLLRFADPFPLEALAAWQEVLNRKAAGEPLQHITGEQEFYGRPFKVTPAVLIPRPETELLVEAILEHARRIWPDGGGLGGSGSRGSGTEPSSLMIGSAGKSQGAAGPQPGDRALLLTDIGTGSGAIAVTIAGERPQWRIVATDLSPAALAVARDNAERNGVSGGMEWLTGDLLQPVLAAGLAPDILVSNPPYIPSGDIAGLQPEVRVYEPLLALDGGEDGLTPYRRLVRQMAELPAYPALVGFEVGMGQADAVAQLLADERQWDWVETVADLAGIARHVLAGRAVNCRI